MYIFKYHKLIIFRQYQGKYNYLVTFKFCSYTFVFVKKNHQIISFEIIYTIHYTCKIKIQGLETSSIYK
jgi:hypothetical protein